MTPKKELQDSFIHMRKITVLSPRGLLSYDKVLHLNSNLFLNTDAQIKTRASSTLADKWARLVNIVLYISAQVRILKERSRAWKPDIAVMDKVLILTIWFWTSL